MSESLPFRDTPAQAAETPAAHNRRLGLRRARAVESFEDARRRMETSGNASPRRIESWVFHPDERVAIALCDSPLLERLTRRERQDAEYLLAYRAVADAEAEGLLWSPLLDRVVQYDVYGFSRMPDVSESDGRPTARELDAHAAIDFADRVVAWLVERRKERDVRLLSGFRSLWLWQNVAMGAPRLTADEVDFILEHMPAVAFRVLQNRDLAWQRKHQVYRWALGVAREASGGEVIADQACKVFWQMARLPAWFVRDAIQLLEGTELEDRVRRALATQIAHRADQMTTEQLARFAPHVPDSRAARAAILAEPNADARFYRVLARTHLRAVGPQLIRIEKAMADPDVLGQLARSRRGDVLVAVLRRAEGEVLARVLPHALRALSHAEASEVLVERMEEMMRHLDGRERSRLFAYPVGEVRRAAIRSLRSGAERPDAAAAGRARR